MTQKTTNGLRGMFGEGRSGSMRCVKSWGLITLLIFLAKGEAAAQTGTKLWGYPAQDVVSHRIGDWAVGIDADGTVLAGYAVESGFIPSFPSGKLVALDASGTAKWTLNTPGAIKSVAIGKDGTAYCGVSYFTQNNLLTTRFVAVNPKGASKWHLEGRSEFSPSAIAADGTIYTADAENLHALNPDGTIKWKHVLGTVEDVTFLSSRAPAVAADGTIYIDGNDARLRAIDPDGREKWRFRAGIAKDLSPPAIGADGTIYVGGTISTNSSNFGGELLAINPNGTLKWQFMTGGIVQASPVVGRDGTVYAAAWDGRLYAVKDDGTLRWSFAADGDLGYSAVLDQDENIYFAAFDQKIYALNSQGTKLWEFKTHFGSTSAAPVIGANGTIYIGDPDGRLIALGGPKGPSNAPWPQLQQGAGHTARSSAPPPEGILPTITSDPHGQSTNSGARVMMQVTAISPTPVTYQWRRDDRNLADQTNATLILESVTLENAGRYTVQIRNAAGAVSSSPAELSVNPVLATTAVPIALTGWNLDVIQENAKTNSSNGFETIMFLQLKDTVGSRWFEAGLDGRQDGLPSSRRMVSAANPKVVFELQPYASNNVLKLFTSSSNHTSTLTLTKPARYHTLHLLAASATSGGGMGSLVLNFADGTSSPPIPFMAQNWFEPSAKMAITGLSSLQLGLGPKVYNKWNDGAGLHQTDIDLAARGLNEKPLQSITFSKPGFRNSPYATGIFAVSGIPGEAAPQGRLGIPRRLGDGAIELSVSELAGQGRAIEVSFDLVMWTVLTNLLPGVDVLRLADSSSSGLPYQFYRCTP